jgi:hypothetical protein
MESITAVQIKSNDHKLCSDHVSKTSSCTVQNTSRNCTDVWRQGSTDVGNRKELKQLETSYRTALESERVYVVPLQQEGGMCPTLTQYSNCTEATESQAWLKHRLCLVHSFTPGQQGNSIQWIRLSIVVSYGLKQSRMKSCICGVVTKRVPLWSALRLPSAGHRSVTQQTRTGLLRDTITFSSQRETESKPPTLKLIMTLTLYNHWARKVHLAKKEHGYSYTALQSEK